MSSRKYLIFYGNFKSCKLIRMSEQIREDFKDKNLMVVNVYGTNNPIVIIRNKDGNYLYQFSGTTYDQLKDFVTYHLK